MHDENILRKNNDINDNDISSDADKHNLTINDFRFSKIKLYSKYPKIEKEQLLIKVIKTDPVYKSLSSLYHRSYINHNIPEIQNSSPTLEQFWQELKVYRRDIQDISNVPIKKRPPKASFFSDININFATAKNARLHKYKKLIPIYYYYFNTEKNKPEFMSINEAKRIYCKMYEKDIMENEESRNAFMLLLFQCKSRNNKFPIVIRGYGVVDNMESSSNLKKIFEDEKLEFGCEYCLVEMLMHYPNLNECLWNV